MAESDILTKDVQAAVEKLGEADIVVGIPSYNNSRTIRHVVRAVRHAGEHFGNLVVYYRLNDIVPPATRAAQAQRQQQQQRQQ